AALRPGHPAAAGGPELRAGRRGAGGPGPLSRRPGADLLGGEGLRLRPALPGRVAAAVPAGGSPPVRGRGALRAGGRGGRGRFAGPYLSPGPPALSPGTVFVTPFLTGSKACWPVPMGPCRRVGTAVALPFLPTPPAGGWREERAFPRTTTF